MVTIKLNVIDLFLEVEEFFTVVKELVFGLVVVEDERGESIFEVDFEDGVVRKGVSLLYIFLIFGRRVIGIF